MIANRADRSKDESPYLRVNADCVQSALDASVYYFTETDCFSGKSLDEPPAINV
jgi:hypothetical protein